MIKEQYWNNPTGQSFHYVVYLPDDYNATCAYPAVIFLHGYGESGPEDGSHIEELYKYGWLYRAKYQGEKFPCIIIAPQCPINKIWGNFSESLNGFLDAMTVLYEIDTKRIYLTGLSMGGTGTWQWAQQNPERFAAIAPVCGTGIYWYADNLEDTPVWAFHGALDTCVPPEESLSMVKAVNMAGGQAKITIFENVDHASWNPAYEGLTLLNWLLEHKL